MTGRELWPSTAVRGDCHPAAGRSAHRPLARHVRSTHYEQNYSRPRLSTADLGLVAFLFLAADSTRIQARPGSLSALALARSLVANLVA